MEKSCLDSNKTSKNRPLFRPLKNANPRPQKVTNILNLLVQTAY